MTSAPDTATAMLAAVRAGSISVEEWVRACLDRIGERDGEIHAWAHVSRDQALAEARRLDRSQERGPLFGMPFGVKDVILTQDCPTSYNSPIYEGFHPRIDAACVKILRAAGALVLGKTETVEFAAAHRLAPTRNPLDTARTPGGSSSGSAAAVADGHVPVALGTQTGGSLIRPASYCGIFAFKPTWSRVSRDGVKMYAASLDTLGWFARSVADLALVNRVLTPEPFAEAPPCGTVAGKRVAICVTPFPERAEDHTRAGLAAAAARLAEAGAQVETLALPQAFDGIDVSHRVIMRSEGRTAFLPEYRADHALLNEHFRALVENADGNDDASLVAAHDHAATCRALFDRMAGEYDAVLTFSVPGEAPVGLSNNGSADFNSLWTLLHAPCVNIPVFFGPAGMPVGLTVTGPRFSDSRTLQMAEAIHRAVALPHPAREKTAAI